MRRALVAAIVVLSCAGVAQAGPIAITSSDVGMTQWRALVNLSYGSFTAAIGATGTAVPITPHPAWNATPPNWISYAPTGYGDAVLAPTYNTPIANPEPALQRQAIVSFTRTFSGSAGNTLYMKLWADDTAFMRLDGGAWVPTAHAWAQSTCETNPTSCTAPKFSENTFTLGFTGDHKLEILAYQIGTGTTTTSNPFGIQYEGQLTVPDPGSSLILLGMGLAGLTAFKRRRG